jgi:hypothetical protein
MTGYIGKLLSFEKTMEWVNSPQAEGRINHEDNLTRLFHDIMKENKDRRPNSEWEMSVFLRREEI